MNIIDHVTLDGVTKYIKDSAGQAMLAPEEVSTTAANAYAIGELFRYDGKLYKATSVIAAGDTIVIEGNEANCTEEQIVNLMVKDIQINNTSILNNNIANINTNGTYYGIEYDTQNKMLQLPNTTDQQVKNGDYSRVAVPIQKQHYAVFYGLSKAAGVDLAFQTVTLGTYPETSKTAIRNMLGAVSSDVIAVQDEQPTATDTKVWLPETAAEGIEVPTYAEHQALASTVAGLPSDVQVNGISIVSNGVANIPIATSNGNLGLSRIDSGQGITITTNNNTLSISSASTELIKTGVNSKKPIVPEHQHEAVFYGLAKAAGDTTQSISTNAVGTYTDDASAAIRNMLGAVGDVQANGTSVVNNGVANIPMASTTALGVVGIGATFGVRINESGKLYVDSASDAAIKSGTVPYSPISAMNAYKAVFYGLARAAGDTTQSASDNEIGAYTTTAKAAIHTMLGIDPASIAAQVDIPLVETVSGTTPTITGQPNVRYVCGEVSTITLTPPASGSMDVIFESGSTAAVLTVPNTVKWPAWFDATALETDTTYEILITDGVYGSVMTWAT